METNAGVVLQLHVEIGEPKRVGDTGSGVLTIIPITGGTFTGQGLSGRVLPGGADWNLRLPDGSAHLHARYWIETGDGAVIAVDNEGTAQAGAPGASVPTTPRFTCDRHSKYAWLMEGNYSARVSGSGANAVDVVVRRA